MKKLLAMISQPMKGISDIDLVVTKQKASEYLRSLGYSVANTYFMGFDISRVKNAPLYYLAKSLEVMSSCDVVYFCKGWENARGCQIEYQCAVEYGIKIIKEEE
jgi:hypothetical protein